MHGGKDIYLKRSLNILFSEGLEIKYILLAMEYNVIFGSEYIVYSIALCTGKILSGRRLNF